MNVEQLTEREIDYKARVALVNHLQNYLFKKISGSNITRLNDGSHPEDTFFIGRISGNKDDMNGKYSYSEPKQIGLTFRIKKNYLKDEIVKVDISGDFYLRVNPTYEEQCRYYLSEFNNRYPEEKLKNFNELKKKIHDYTDFNCDVLPVFEKIKMNYSFNLNFYEICGDNSSGKRYLDNIRNEIFLVRAVFLHRYNRGAADLKEK